MQPDAPFAQSKYQVRFEWGAEGLERLAPADVIVLVDALSFTTAVVAAAEHGLAVAPWPKHEPGAEEFAAGLGDGTALSAPAAFLAALATGQELPAHPGAVLVLASPNGASLARGLARREAAPSDGAEPPVVLAASLRNRTAVARRILALQEAHGRRLSVAILAAGERGGDGVRFAVEDQLAGGAVVDALVALGIDHTSPEAAVACAAFEGLRRAVGHLQSASGSGAELLQRGVGEGVAAAAQTDVTELVPELRGEVFRID
ncbi:2-phosphosulfolactate phosphatase [Agromyces mediolanus]|uniref:2-phosphosulfolactate phosphatase n=1 Tax=Agromyces mediolanus TaxID=41986 RepID=UPI00203F77FF|nr:2-phosphosulfolactate phosphatase [Agromyces mediolanus]MCM3655643.1 2-phosphosulfolactate phosphatase [Agromyces mediolanus]